MRPAAAWAAWVALVACAGCYRYTPIESGPSAVGREVVLELSDRGSVELGPTLGAQLKSVSGEITGYGNDVFHVLLTQTRSRGGVETLWRGETADIPRMYVVSVGDRQLDKPRTWTVAGLAVVGVALAGRAFGVNVGLDGLLGSGRRGGRQ